jgi:putative FmdB family regulatory protein
MPICEYAWQDCHREFEAFVRSDAIPACPRCHSTHLEQRSSVFASAAPAPCLAHSAHFPDAALTFEFDLADFSIVALQPIPARRVAGAVPSRWLPG